MWQADVSSALNQILKNTIQDTLRSHGPKHGILITKKNIIDYVIAPCQTVNFCLEIAEQSAFNRDDFYNILLCLIQIICQ